MHIHMFYTLFSGVVDFVSASSKLHSQAKQRLGLWHLSPGLVTPLSEFPKIKGALI